MTYKAYETSSAQKRLYMINNLLGESILYNETRVWRIEGELNPGRLAHAVKQISCRHETLRTCFVMSEGEVLQKVYDSIESNFKYTEIKTDKSGSTSKKEVEEGIIANFLTPYGLGEAPLWKIELVQMSENRQLLLLDFHHIIADGTSMDVILSELISFYLGKEMPELEVQYVDFAIWQNDLFADERIKKQESYWLKVFGGELPVLDMPLDFPRPVQVDISGSSIDFKISEKLSAGIKELAIQEKTTLYVVLLAAFNVLLSKYSGQEDIVVGTPVTGRTHREFDNIIGMFVNTLAMRNQPAAGKTFATFFREVSQYVFEAFENQDYQFEMLVEKVAPQRELNRNPLFDVLFALQNYSQGIEIGNRGDGTLVFTPYEYEPAVSKFDLALQAIEVERHIAFKLEFRTSLFRRETIERLSNHFISILEQVTDNSGLKLSEVRIITPAEQDYLLYQLNRTSSGYPVNSTIHELYGRETVKTPDKIALKGASHRCKQHIHLSYKQLANVSNQLSHQLIEKGVESGVIVGIMLERSVELIVCLLGILKAGGVYLPIDPDYPEERVNFMLADSSVKFLINRSDSFSDLINKKGIKTISIDNDSWGSPVHLDFSSSTAASLAYIIYTSGSTGRPRGVMVEHRNVIRLVKNSDYLEFREEQRLLMTGSPVFDIKTFEIWGPLLNGLSLFVPDKDVILDMERLKETVIKNRITILHLIPQVFYQVMDRSPGVFRGLEYFLVGGDLVRPGPVNRLREKQEHLKIIHAYGPTENTTFSTTFRVDSDYSDRIPIGKPINHSTVFILDGHGQLQPPGVNGELCTGGDGVARGYLNNPQLTSKKFKTNTAKTVPDNVTKHHNKKLLRGVQGGSFLEKSPPGRRRQKLYKTGDLVRWQLDGNILFLGRIEQLQQVKIRGIRIELGEIEARLLRHKQVKEAVVIDREDRDQDRYLCAYIVPCGEFDLEELKNYLLLYLPAYMVPAYFIQIERIPVTANGKIDKKVLPVPGIEIDAGEDFKAPVSEIERKLVKIWSEVLRIDESVIGTNGNFFELGGHSLKAAILLSEIHKQFSVRIPLAEIFRTPFIRDLAGHIKNTAQDMHAVIEPVEKKEYYALSSAQKRLYFLQQIDQDSTGYNMPFVFPLGDEIETNKLEITLKQMIARHESLRTSFERVNERPVQRIHDEVEFKIEFSDFPGTSQPVEPGTGNRAMAAGAIKNFIRSFDLSQAPLIRSGLIRNADNTYTWLVDMHHIVSDGTSHMILIEDFISLYNNEALEPLRFQYKDFSRWQNHRFESGQTRAQERYWLDLYPDAKEIPRVQMPIDFPRPAVFTFAGDTYRVILEREDALKFKALGARNNATLYMNMLAVLNTLLYRYGGQTDIIIGSGIAGRPHADLQRILGMFVNTLAMRNFPDGEKEYETFLGEVTAHSVKAFENQDVQFEELVDKLAIERDPSRNPLFDISMVVQNLRLARRGGSTSTKVREKESPGEMQIGPDKNPPVPALQYQNPTAKFDMTFFVHEEGEDIIINIEYYTAIFKKETIKRLAQHLKNIVKAVVKNPVVRLADIDIMSEQEKTRVLYEFNDTASIFPSDKTIHQLFADQVQKAPDYVVLIETHLESRISPSSLADQFGSVSAGNQLTYRILDEQADQLANYLLVKKNLQPEEVVGVLMERSAFLMIALSGILKASGAYVPLDPDYPEERLKDIIDDADAGIVISLKNHVKNLNRLQWECPGLHTFLCLDTTDIYSEKEIQPSGLMAPELWEYVGETASDDITGGGWLTGTTGQPFTREEMDEYGDNALKKLIPLLNKDTRVLEIGCASGITMYRIAPLVGFYYGTDLSRVTIEKNKRKIQQEGLENIKLACLPAHDISEIKDEEKKFDLVIINSVVQSFHGHNYFRQMIRQLLDLTADQGYWFIGDVMDQELKKDLIGFMKKFKKTNAGKNYTTKTDWSEELFLSRSFFKDLTIEFPGIHKVEFSRKISTIENELTLFRFDALLKIDKSTSSESTELKHKYQEDASSLPRLKKKKPLPHTMSHQLAYVIYTSGSTGKPKGVMVQHRNVVRLTKNTNFIRWDQNHRLLPTGSVSFDISTFELWGPPVNCSGLVMTHKSTLLDGTRLEKIVRQHRITHLHLIPQLFDQLAPNHPGLFSNLTYLLMGGDLVRTRYVNDIRKQFKSLKILHMYGPTENTTFSTFFPVDTVYRETLPIGKPISNTSVYILDKFLNLLPIGVCGELCTGGPGLARGYLNDPQLTAKKFCLRRPGALFKKTAPGPRKNFLLMGVGDFLNSSFYLTGDLGRWRNDGNIEFLGRMDSQVKIRGFRIELGEIESRLLTHDSIKNTTVIDRVDENGEKYLCAYIDVNEMNDKFDSTGIKDFLSGFLPDFMIPAYIITIDHIPVTTQGKINRKALPNPVDIIATGETFTAPRDFIEEKLVEIWAEILLLDKEKISTDASFFDLGGHSLRATVLTAKIHKALEVQVPLAEVFNRRTIKELSKYIRESSKRIYAEIKPVEKAEYYTLSSAQKRLYFIQQMDLDSTAYNMPLVLPLKDTTINRLETSLNALISRHESLRTSFTPVKEIPVQRIHENSTHPDSKGVKLKIEYHDLYKNLTPSPVLPDDSIKNMIKNFIRPFDLSQAPLLRSALIKLPDNTYIWMVDIHHIISDGTSHTILTEDFMALYNEEKLNPLRLQYKDFSQWQNHLFESGKIDRQEKYWLELYRDVEEIPRLDLAYDFKRPEVFTFQGDSFSFALEKNDAIKFKALGTRNNGTLYMNILAALNTLFYRYTGQSNIIIGTGVAGRPHVDLQPIMGMFVNTLPIRNYPAGDQSYESFLQDVIANSLKAFENQDVQFEELVDHLEVERNPSRNPLFDITMVVQNFRRINENVQEKENTNQFEYPPLADENLPFINYENPTTKFDMTFFVYEQEEDVHFTIEYYTGIFKDETVNRLAMHLKNIVKAVIEEPSVKLKDIELLSGCEKQQLIYEWNETSMPYPADNTIHQCFEEQVQRTPDHSALVGSKAEGMDTVSITYKELNQKTNRLAGYLFKEKNLRPQDRVGILMSQSPDRPAAVLGILKAGGAYVPLDPLSPYERIKYIINDAGIGVVISEKAYIRNLNRLQWECDGFHTYLCLDSDNIYKEKEVEKNELMDLELWHHVGETAADEITGGGWISSYTGQPFSQQEMDEYGDNILKKVEPLLHSRMRVLEIGCASGISMYRIAPKVALYFGTDLSGVIIDKNKNRIEKENHHNIKLACLPAHEIDQIEEKDFHLVIMNSVIQCFHGHNYLKQVLGKAVNLLGEEGYLFIGDIMDQDKKEILVRKLAEFKTAHSQKKHQKNDKNYSTRTDFSSELFLSRRFWTDLEIEFKEIRFVEFTDKIYTIENELTEFRYDILIKVNKSDKAAVTGNKIKKEKYQDDSRCLPGSGFDSPGINSKLLNLFPANMAYIIYTSGTTGKPKGVMIEHSSLNNLCQWHNRYYQVTASDHATFYANFGFDASVWELFPYLVKGATLYIIRDSIKLDIEELTGYFQRNQVTISFLPTRFCEQFISFSGTNQLSSLRILLTGGDKLHTYSNRKTNYALYNNYGPTENTVVTAVYHVETHQDNIPMENIPIGKPIKNTNIYILDPTHLTLKPIGAAGELCISGKGLARGYLNQPILTAQKFTINKKLLRKMADSGGETTRFLEKSPHGGRRQNIYKTGDLARWLTDGNLQFLGRIDQQVKIRGNRIELGEIESCLTGIENINKAVAAVKEDKNGDKYICAYLVPGSQQESLDKAGIKIELSKKLPGYMIPSYLVEIKDIPLTSGGKTNLKALPDPVRKVTDSYIAPGNKIEKKLADIWSQVLGIEPGIIGTDDNFFERGGHSLNATILVTKLHRAIELRVPLAQVFKTPTIRGLANYITLSYSSLNNKSNRLASYLDRENLLREGQPRDPDDHLILMKKGTDKEKNLFFIHDGTGEIDGYIHFCRNLDDQYNCWGIAAQRKSILAPQNLTIEEIAGNYILKLKSQQPRGPYRVMGWSLGGTIAFEMVRQLESKGENVVLLAMFDVPDIPGDITDPVHIDQFTLESEIDWINRYLLVKQLQGKFSQAADMNQLWQGIAGILTSHHIDATGIREKIREYSDHEAAGSEQWSIEELIQRYNEKRTFWRARLLYQPGGKIKAPVYYFQASNQEKNETGDPEWWSQYCSSPVNSYLIQGDHFSIFNEPTSAKMAGIFNNLVQQHDSTT